VICLVLAVPFFLAFLLYEQRITKQGKTPLIRLSLLQHRRFSSGILTVRLAYGLFSAMLFLFAFYLQTILRLTPLRAGLVIMTTSLAYALASVFNSVIASRLGKRSMLIAALLVMVSYLLTCLATQFLVGWWGLPPLLVPLFILGAGMGTLMAPLLNKTLEGVAPHDAGAASGIFTTAMSTAGALGVAVIGLLDAALMGAAVVLCTPSFSRPLWSRCSALASCSRSNPSPNRSRLQQRAERTEQATCD